MNMLFLRRLPTGDALTKVAQRLGVSLDETGRASGTRVEHEVQRRVLEAVRARRDSWLWLLALVSALASFASACAAWLAVLKAR